MTQEFIIKKTNDCICYQQKLKEIIKEKLSQEEIGQGKKRKCQEKMK